MKRGNTKLSIFIAVILLAAAQSVALAGDVDISGTGAANGYVFEALSTATGDVNRTAIHGKAIPSANYGTGGAFEGGVMGVVGTAIQTTTGAQNRWGGVFFAANSTVKNGGVYGYAYGTAPYNYGFYGTASGADKNFGYYATLTGSAYKNYGLYGTSSGAATGGNYGVVGYASNGSSNYGVYGNAPVATNSYAGYFAGDLVWTGDHYKVSDERLKTDVAELYGALEQVMQLKPKSFRYLTKEYPEINLPERYQNGLIAQEVGEVFPDLVADIAIPTPDEDSDGNIINNTNKGDSFLAIDYIQLIPVLIKAIQEQQEQIAELQAMVAMRRK